MKEMKFVTLKPKSRTSVMKLLFLQEYQIYIVREICVEERDKDPHRGGSEPRGWRCTYVSIRLRGANSVAVGAELRRGLVPKTQNIPQKYIFLKIK